MNTDAYSLAAQAYADQVRVLRAPTGVRAGERGGHGPTSPEELAQQAERLAPLSDSLTAAAAAKLTATNDPAVRAQASTQLLAKALTDLEVSAQLYQAAQDEAANIAWAPGGTGERSAGGHAPANDLLDVLLDTQPRAAARERGSAKPERREDAPASLLQATEDTLALISERATKTGKTAFGGLVGLGLAQVGQAAGVLGMDLAKSFGVADQVSRLVGLFRDFALKAYESVLALLGPNLAQLAGQQVLEWIEQIKQADFFGDLIEKLYQTNQTQSRLAELANNSSADLPRFQAAITRVEGLNEEYGRQLRLVDKLLKGLKFFAGASALLPYGSVLMAAVYVVLCAYVVFAGADYVDAEQLRLLNRVPGVRQAVEAELARV